MAKKHTDPKNMLTKKSKLWFGKYKDKTVEFVLKNDPNYLHWLIDNKIQYIELSKEIKLPVKKRKYTRSYNDEPYSRPDDLDREYASQRRDEYPSTRWGEDGDYYPNGCDIYGFG